MNAKIEWYREVLELEPGSKVFFPLARLLGEEGQSEDAIRVLRQGLERHPEYLEARLLLVELLHTCDPANGTGGTRGTGGTGGTDVAGGGAGKELAGITAMLSAYPGFWSAWSRQSAGTGTGLALAFLAAAMHTPGLTLEQIFSSGLQQCETGAGSLAYTDPRPGDGGEPADAVPATGQELASLAAALRTRDGKPKPGPTVPRATLPERVTLRTRSMAEVLAEQGDIQGAIDIYTEMLAAASPGHEADELQGRIQSLRGTLDPLAALGDEDAIETGATTAADDAVAPSGKKMRTMLESLAQRLDARAKN